MVWRHSSESWNPGEERGLDSRVKPENDIIKQSPLPYLDTIVPKVKTTDLNENDEIRVKKIVFKRIYGSMLLWNGYSLHNWRIERANPTALDVKTGLSGATAH